FHRSQLQAGRNVSFSKGMSVPAFSKVNGKLWMDASYIRDYTIASGKDSTTFRGGDKNGHNPNTWDATTGMLPPKIDIVDAFMHFRRNGLQVTDSLWFFTGVSTVGVEGDRYYDIELYKKSLNYNKANGSFNTTGLTGGHTEWLFDPLGNIIQTGDMIIAVSYSAWTAPVIELRIWVSRATFLTANPRLFNMGNVLDGTTLSGYVTISSKDGLNNFGSGVANFSNSANNDSTYSTPWGSTLKNQGWMPIYESLHFMEVGINFSRIGLDPAMYNEVLGNSGCGKIYSSAFIKSRASTSFTSALHDFVGPAHFTAPALNFSVSADTITCANPVATLAIDNSSVGSYTWTTMDGNIVDTTSDNSQISVDSKGTYQVMSSIAAGCPTTRVDRVRVEKDDFKPIATADITLTDDGLIQLLGGDSVKSNYMTPYGKSKGLTWHWTGPNNWTSNLQNPVIDLEWAWGSYYLTVTEQRNGCSASTPMDISFRSMPKKPVGQQAFVSEKNGALMLHTIQIKKSTGTVIVYGSNGQILGKRFVHLNEGLNQIELPVQKANQVRIVSLYVGKEKVLTRKTVF
ncbi:MAG TPA: hypothetical protein VGC29_03770, partial [Flavisolibacter sp.]